MNAEVQADITAFLQGAIPTARVWVNKEGHVQVNASTFSFQDLREILLVASLYQCRTIESGDIKRSSSDLRVILDTDATEVQRLNFDGDVYALGTALGINFAVVEDAETSEQEHGLPTDDESDENEHDDEPHTSPTPVDKTVNAGQFGLGQVRLLKNFTHARTTYKTDSIMDRCECPKNSRHTMLHMTWVYSSAHGPLALKDDEFYSLSDYRTVEQGNTTGTGAPE